MQRRGVVKLLLSCLKAHPCTDCGQRYPACCMDFDHRPGTQKVAALSKLASGQNWRALIEEVQKCDLVCAICHRLRTWARASA